MKLVYPYEDIQRMIRRLTHEIIEKNPVLTDIILVGILKKGLPLAKLIHSNLQTYGGVDVALSELDISSYRDDEKKTPGKITSIDVSHKICILVDDVLYTGRTARAAMDALIDLGRPAKIQLAVLVDRGHRELPIRADFVGKNLPTSKEERIIVDVTSDKPGIYIERVED